MVGFFYSGQLYICVRKKNSCSQNITSPATSGNKIWDKALFFPKKPSELGPSFLSLLPGNCCLIQRFFFWASFLRRDNNYGVKFHQYAWKLLCNIKPCAFLLINIIADTIKVAYFKDEISYQNEFFCNTKHNLVQMEKNFWFWKLPRPARGS